MKRNKYLVCDTTDNKIYIDKFTKEEIKNLEITYNDLIFFKITKDTKINLRGVYK